MALCNLHPGVQGHSRSLNRRRLSIHHDGDLMPPALFGDFLVTKSDSANGGILLSLKTVIFSTLPSQHLVFAYN